MNTSLRQVSAEVGESTPDVWVREYTVILPSGERFPVVGETAARDWTKDGGTYVKSSGKWGKA